MHSGANRIEARFAAPRSSMGGEMRFLTKVAGAIVVGFLSLSTAWASCNGKNVWPDLQRKYPSALKAVEERAARIPYGEGKLFRATKQGIAPSYVLGTIHIYDPRLFPLSRAIRDALGETRLTILELEKVEAADFEQLFAELSPSLLLEIFAQANERPLDFLTENEQQALTETAEKLKMPLSTALTLRPTLLAGVIETLICSDPQEQAKHGGVDVAIARMTKAGGRQIVGLETIREQLESMNALPIKEQKDLLRSALKSKSRNENMRETLLLHYMSGQIGKMLALGTDTSAELKAEFDDMSPAFLDKMVDSRNIRMRDRALPHLDRGGVFIAVGALHLPGENGLLKLIEANGYTIERME